MSLARHYRTRVYIDDGESDINRKVESPRPGVMVVVRSES